MNEAIADIENTVEKIRQEKKEDVDNKQILIVNNISILNKDKIGTVLKGKNKNREKRSAKKLSGGTKHGSNSGLEVVDSKKYSFQDKQSKKKNGHQERESIHAAKKEKPPRNKNKERNFIK